MLKFNVGPTYVFGLIRRNRPSSSGSRWQPSPSKGDHLSTLSSAETSQIHLLRHWHPPILQLPFLFCFSTSLHKLPAISCHAQMTSGPVQVCLQTTGTLQEVMYEGSGISLSQSKTSERRRSLHSGPNINDLLAETLSISVFVCLTNVNVLQWYSGCLFLWLVQINSRLFVTTGNQISAHGPRTFTGTLSLDARLEHNIIFLLEVALGWWQWSTAARIFDGFGWRGEINLECYEYSWLLNLLTKMSAASNSCRFLQKASSMSHDQTTSRS